MLAVNIYTAEERKKKKLLKMLLLSSLQVFWFTGIHKRCKLFQIWLKYKGFIKIQGGGWKNNKKHSPNQAHGNFSIGCAVPRLQMGI